jgi:hypothetical protein
VDRHDKLRCPHADRLLTPLLTDICAGTISGRDAISNPHDPPVSIAAVRCWMRSRARTPSESLTRG